MNNMILCRACARSMGVIETFNGKVVYTGSDVPFEGSACNKSCEACRACSDCPVRFEKGQTCRDLECNYAPQEA